MPYFGREGKLGVRNRFQYLASNGDTSVSGSDAKMALAEFIARNWDEVMNMPMAEFSKFMESYMSSYDEMLTDKEVDVQSK